MKKNKLMMLIIAFIVTLGFQNSQLSHSGNHFFNATIVSATSASTTDTDAAEKAVKQLEDHQTRKNLTNAQQKVDTIADANKKEKLQHRINLVEQAITIKEAQTAVKYLEDHQSRDNITNAKTKTDLVTDEGTKANLTNRINLVENAITIKEAQAAVKYLEDHQSRDNITDAKNKTDLVTDEGTKANLINRINLVENAIAIKEGQTTESTTPSQEDRIVYVTGGGKSKVYWYSTEYMPWNTNKNNIIQMKESEAIAAGKRHSLTEPS